MNIDKVTSGDNIPEEINVIIEIPLQSDPVKYEVDKKTGAMFVDRFLTTAMYYPCNYGYIPKTLSQDGDPVDVLVIAPYPLACGCVITCRPIGLLQMTDEAGNDAKLLAVPIDKLSNLYHDIQSYKDVSSHLLATIAHFFSHYKDLEPQKWVRIHDWQDVDSAKKEIMDSIERYQKNGIQK